MHTILRFNVLFIAALVSSVNGNVEKEIFLGPPPATTEHDATLQRAFQRLPRITPDSCKLETTWTTSFDRTGKEHWVVLDDLVEGQRYETRICWPATQPTDFWLRVYTPAEIVADRRLLDSVNGYARNKTQTSQLAAEARGNIAIPPRLYFRALAKAAYFAHDPKRMENAEPVDVDIILDPFILNVFPKSLTRTAIYVAAVAVFSWILSGWVYSFIVGLGRLGGRGESEEENLLKKGQ